jgi:hypothetical protein
MTRVCKKGNGLQTRTTEHQLPQQFGLMVGSVLL